MRLLIGGSWVLISGSWVRPHNFHHRGSKELARSDPILAALSEPARDAPPGTRVKPLAERERVERCDSPRAPLYPPSYSAGAGGADAADAVGPSYSLGTGVKLVEDM